MWRVVTFCITVLCMWANPTHPSSANEPIAFNKGDFATIREWHKGDMLVVAFWSLTCAPCLAEMSIWHEILETHPDLTVVLVSTDKLEDSERIENLLERHQLTGVESWVFADPFVERLRYDVDPKWRGELPRTYFIDVSGKLHAHSGMVDPATLKSWLTASGVP